MNHNFSPNKYYLSIGSHEPVLKVRSGDTINTTTADAGGRDLHGEVVSHRGNPQTGPFYIQDTHPGDVLAVTLDKVWPNRGDGFCRPAIASNVLEYFLVEAPSKNL